MLKRDKILVDGKYAFDGWYVLEGRDKFSSMGVVGSSTPLAKKVLLEDAIRQKVFNHYYSYLKDHVAEIIEAYQSDQNVDDLIAALKHLEIVLSGEIELHPDIAESEDSLDSPDYGPNRNSRSRLYRGDRPPIDR